MKNSYFLLLFSLVGLIYSCSETKVQKEADKSPVELTVFNDFVPAYLSDIPNLDLEPRKYDNYAMGKYSLDAFVDSINEQSIYWKIEDTTSNLIYQGFTLNGEKDGWWEVVQNKTLLSSGHFASNKKNGFWRYYKLEGESKKFVHFLNDTLVGLAQEFNADSILLSEGNYIKGLKSDYWKFNYNNGKIKEQGYFYNGYKSGLWRYFYLISSDSVLMSEGNYLNGLKTDYWKFYYDNGKIKEQGYFYNGYKSGWWQSFELSGNLTDEGSYSANEISGFTKKYLNGVLFEEGKLFNGERRGTWKTYDENGDIKRIHDYGK